MEQEAGPRGAKPLTSGGCRSGNVNSWMRVTTTTVVVILCLAARAAAQSSVIAVPSVTIGGVYDDNLFAKVRGSAGQMLLFRPALEADVKTPRIDLGSEWSFDAQRSNFASLNTLDARRHAVLDLHYRTTTATTLGFATRYDRTETPGEVNGDTGILGDRLQAHRWQITPSISHQIRPRTAIRASYDFTDETLTEENATGRLHTIRTGVAQQVSERTTLTASYMARQFVDRYDINTSHSFLGGIDRELGPGKRFTFQGGPRISTYHGPNPELTVGYVYGRNRLGFVADYWHGETIILGVRGPVAVDSGSARTSYRLTKAIEFGTHTGASSISTIDNRQIAVYRGTLQASWSLGDWYTVSGSYGLDYQTGDIRHARTFLDGEELFLNDRIVRHVFRVSMTIAPRLSRTILPPDEAARAKGVIR